MSAQVGIGTTSPNNKAMLDAVIPFPRPEQTPPVTNTYFVI